MKWQYLCSALLLMASNLSFAEPKVVFYSGDYKIGTLISTGIGTFADEVQLIDEQGYRIWISPIGSPLGGATTLSFYTKEDVFYESENCTGDAYISSDLSSNRGWKRPGGVIFKPASDIPNQVYRLGYLTPRTQADSCSTGTESDCVAGTCETLDAYPVDVLAATDIGMTQLNDSNTWRWADVTVSIERPNAVFCNGFESCPSQ